MIAETARWQLRDIPINQAGLLASVYSATSALLADVGLATDGGTIPNVEALKLGAGHVLRNAYIETFGSMIGEGATGDANANTLSDAWKTLLGFRPLALTRVAGNGTKSFDQGDGRVAAEAPLGSVQDAAVDHLGNLYLTEHDNGLLRFVPKGGHAAMLGQTDPMTDGLIYTLAGQINTGTDLASFNDLYAAAEAASVADPSAAPLLSAGHALIRPRKLLLQRVGATDDSHLFVLSKFGQRVFFIPATNVTVFGRDFLAGRLYTVLGNGLVAGQPDVLSEEGSPGHAFALNEPTAMAQDSAGNLYVLDSIAGAVRLVRAGDGSVITLPLKADASTAYAAVGAQDLRVVEGAANFLYLADTNAHTVVRFPLPANLADLAGAVPDMTAQTVFGVAGTPGYIKAGLTYPDIHDASKALSEANALLNEPTSLTFDGDGNMIVAAKGRLHMMEAAALDPGTVGNTYVIAGGIDTRNIVGDARLGYFPATTSVRYDAASKNVLVVDNAENVVRRLWTARGTL
jgi:sugar lactone lactonase YvrE